MDAIVERLFTLLSRASRFEDDHTAPVVRGDAAYLIPHSRGDDHTTLVASEGAASLIHHSQEKPSRHHLNFSFVSSSFPSANKLVGTAAMSYQCRSKSGTDLNICTLSARLYVSLRFFLQCEVIPNSLCSRSWFWVCLRRIRFAGSPPLQSLV